MRKSLIGFALTTSLIALVAFGQTPSPTETPSPAPMLVSTATPSPSPTPSGSPNDVGTVSVPSTLSTPGLSPIESPSATPIAIQAAGLGKSDLGWSERGSPLFKIDQAVILALQQNPAVRNALEEIRRTKGVIIQIRAEALPQIAPSFSWGWTDPNLTNNTSGFSTFSGGGGGGGGGGGNGGIKNLRSDITYNGKVTGTQLVFNYSTFSSIRGTFFQRDSAYFALRNIVDQTIANVKTQFYQVIVNRELIVVQEQSVNLLESQLKDQQNRFEAGTVPRFNVLQSEVALANARPQLIQARNDYNVAELNLARTLGITKETFVGNMPPINPVGVLTTEEKPEALPQAIEL